jgi:hypothetical protein
MDVDDEADLHILLQQDLSGTRTGGWLRASGVRKRLGFDSVTKASAAAPL